MIVFTCIRSLTWSAISINNSYCGYIYSLNQGVIYPKNVLNSLLLNFFFCGIEYFDHPFIKVISF